MYTKFWLGNLKGKGQSEDLRRHRDIRMDLTEIGWEDVDWIHLAQKRDQGRALANMVMNLWVT
jgi:hypothetical protein